ncbi:MAG: EAL domain-containing protein [Arenimonas sp.]
MTPPPSTILIVDDEASSRRLLEALLRPEGYLTVCAANAEDALALIARQPPDLIILDVMMPGLDGCQLAGLLKASPATANIPIVMVTALADRKSRLAGLDAGAEDLLTKPVDRAELWLRVRNLLRLKMLGDFHQNHGAILEQKALARAAELQHPAQLDALTGLPNRALFLETLQRCLLQRSDPAWKVAVLVIDIDHDDTRGHAIGDELLRQFSHRLAQCIFVRDTIGWLGGDEFGVILLMPNGQRGATQVANKIRAALRAPFDLDGREVLVTASIGISVHPDDASDAQTLIKYADTAMQRAKQVGRDTFRFFTQQMNADELAELDLKAALRKALDDDEFVLHYQPKVQLDSGRVVGLEALLRWQRPGHGLVAPNVFIPALEASGLIVAVGTWVIATACRQIGQWIQSGIGPMQISVNVSGRQFIDGDLVGDIGKALTDNHLAAELLELELTESSMMANTEHTIATLENLKRLGVQISIDDFGTGFSSLAYLRRFPVDKLKIDIAFIRDITTNPDDAAIVLTIIRLAHALNLQVIAEGVETAEQLAYLRRAQCDQMQGYYFSRPLAVPAIEQLLREDRRLLAPDAEQHARLDEPPRAADDTDLMNALQRLLNKQGYHILSARSAAEGFELLALSDGSMLSLDSGEFLDRLKELSSDTQRIILSGHANLASLLHAINHGAIYQFNNEGGDSRTEPARKIGTPDSA